MDIVDDEAQETTPRVQGSADSLRILIGNLRDNALRYTPMGDQVDVTVACVDGGVLPQVEDDVPGIALAERERVLDRFYRAAGQLESGSELGLSIVRSVADAHGATICLGGGLSGRGLSVTVRFPRVHAKSIV